MWPVDRTLLAATNSCHSGLGSHGNEGVLRISQSSKLLEPHYQIVQFTLGESYLSAEMQLVYSAAPADWPTLEEAEQKKRHGLGIFCLLYLRVAAIILYISKNTESFIDMFISSFIRPSQA